ncbi:MAG: hypothetical protein RMJ43_02630 [Chloroherpetonaceae bacterium]|nr:hypothetical protein [Chthonomonadaceae bacterium]MDW8206706.1 hypothetical protein [Chloroherpetonaceae bacterium]
MGALAPQSSPRETLAALRAQYPDAPFLALGQTVFWDEPVKAVLRHMLDAFGLGGQMVLGVHDTDYFARARGLQGGRGRFVLLPHNDGTTRDLWSAAGEISTLFGCETFPRRQDYVRHGVPLERLARRSPEGRQAFIDRVTEAWGWRGLVYTGAQDLVVHYLPLKEVGDALLEMLQWGFENALVQIAPGCCQGEARQIAEMILDWCQEYRTQNPEKTLSHLFQHLLPRLYALLLGHAPDNVVVDCTASLLRLAPETADLPRFRFVDLFLNPATRAIAVQAYNEAVAGSEIYTLDRFGAGALPFDVVIPERGRGTLRVTPRVLFVETRQPVAIALKRPIESVQELAEVLSRRLGDQVTLVGKAVSLISMLAQEFIFVFNEEGSLYVRRTRRMNQILHSHGIALEMRPILRIRYHTWDALAVGRSTLRPAEHLVAAFGRQSITTPEFAAIWAQVVEEQRALCRDLAAIRKPVHLLEFLRDRQPVAQWEERLVAYQQAKATLRSLRVAAAAVQEEVQARYRRLQELRAESAAVQRAQGAHYREVTAWTPQELERRAEFDARFRAIETAKLRLRLEIEELKRRRWQIERGPEATEARRLLQEIEDEAELARLQIVRNALLTIEGLTHTNHRPSAWWLPMVDRTGEWFRRIAETAELYLEPLI